MDAGGYKLEPEERLLGPVAAGEYKLEPVVAEGKLSLVF